MVVIVEIETEEDELTSNSINEILCDLVGEELDEIHETHVLMMEELERIQIAKIGSLQKDIEEQKENYKKQIEEKQQKYEKERLEMEKSLANLLEKMIENKKELIEIHRKEKENQIIIEMIFDIVTNWTNIDHWFSQLLGIRDALKTVEANMNENEQNTKKNATNIRERMVRKASLILKLHETNKENVTEVLKSINSFLDFVELGMEDQYRTSIMLSLNSMKNVPFWTLEKEENIDVGIDQIEEIVFEVRELLFKLPLCKLRPRRSIRQILWEEIETFEQTNGVSVAF